MGCGVVERHLEMAQPTTKVLNYCNRTDLGMGPTLFKIPNEKGTAFIILGWLDQWHSI